MVPVTFEQRCEAELAPTTVAVVWEPSRMVFDHTRSIQQLSRDGKSSPGHVVLGLTQSTLGSQFTFGMNAITDPVSGRTCMRPQIAVRASAGTQKVFVASEFPKGSCAYQSVLDHELMHARVNDEQALFTARRVEAEIMRSLGKRIFYGTREELEGYLATAIRDHWAPMANKDFARVETDHAHIDSPGENRRVMASCNGELARHALLAARS